MSLYECLRISILGVLEFFFILNDIHGVVIVQLNELSCIKKYISSNARLAFDALSDLLTHTN